MSDAGSVFGGVFGFASRRLRKAPATRVTRACPNDAPSGGEEATDYRRRHHSESESSGGSSNNPWHHRFRTPKLRRRAWRAILSKTVSKFLAQPSRLGTRPPPNRLPKRSENSHTAFPGAVPRLVRFSRFSEPPSARYASAKSETAVSDIDADNGLVRTPKIAKIAPEAARRPGTPCASFRSIWRGARGRSGAAHTLWWRNRKQRQGD